MRGPEVSKKFSWVVDGRAGVGEQARPAPFKSEGRARCRRKDCPSRTPPPPALARSPSYIWHSALCRRRQLRSSALHGCCFGGGVGGGGGGGGGGGRSRAAIVRCPLLLVSSLSLSLSLCLCRKPKPVSPLRRMHLTMLQTCFYPVAYMSLVGTHLVPCLIV